MTEYDILRKIASNFSQRKSSAALSNYLVLGNNIKYANELLKFEAHVFAGIHSAAVRAFEKTSNLNEDFKEGNQLAPFIKIVPRVIANGLAGLEKFCLITEPDDRSGVSVENLGKLKRGFLEYNNLVTATRQLVDSLVSDAYQLYLLDPKSLNYHVLVSLNSFDKYVTRSIKQALFNQEVTEALAEFSRLSFRDWKNSVITKCDHLTFANKIDFLFSELNLTSENDFKEKLKDLFKFSSEFTHIGYISTFFTSSLESEVIFGDDIGPYLPSTENFSELKYEILETAVKLFSQLYLPTVKHSFQKIMSPVACKGAVEGVTSLTLEVMQRLKTRNNEYYFFIKTGLIGSERIIDLTCMCGTLRRWHPPHNDGDLYCKNCGSHFNLMAVDGDGGYIITSSGPIKIIGADVPDFHELPFEEQQRILKQVETLLKEKQNC